MNQPTDKQKQEAREIIGNVNNYAEDDGELSIPAFGPLSQRIALALSSHDQEIREVLEGLSVLLHIDRNAPQRCWCANQPGYAHTPACLATRALWERVQDS